MNLRAKLGPLPRWAWLLLAAVAGYLLYRRYRAGTAVGTQSAMTTVPLTSSLAGASGSDTGLATSAGSPADSGSSTADLLSAYGQSESSLLTALASANSDIVSLAQSQIAAAQASGLSPSTTTETQAVGGQQPGGPNAPVIMYVNPNASGAASPPPASSTAARSSAVTSPTRYFTYYTQAAKAARPGQTVHFHSGHGYYLV